MANGNFDTQAFFSGINPTGGGFDIMGNPIAAPMPGGGALSGLGSIAGGIADIVGAKKDIRRAKKQRAKARGQIKDFYEAEASGKYDMLTSQAERDLASAAQRTTDTSQMGQNLATSMGALSSDPRALLGGAFGLQRAADTQALAAGQSDFAREIAAKSRLAGQEQRTLDANRNLDRALGMRQLQSAEQAKAQAIQNAADARQARREGFANIIGGVGDIATSAITAGMMQEGGKVPEGQPEGDLLSMLLGAAEGTNMQKTPGEFSHEDNPIHMVDDSGNKVGEATGGEYILNPAQAEEIDAVQQEISEKIEGGKKPSRDELMLLYKAVRGVFSQPQFDE